MGVFSAKDSVAALVTIFAQDRRLQGKLKSYIDILDGLHSSTKAKKTSRFLGAMRCQGRLHRLYHFITHRNILQRAPTDRNVQSTF